MKSATIRSSVLLISMAAAFVVSAQHRFPPSSSRQNDELPQILRPSDYAIVRARELGGKVFKMLPLELNHPAMAAFNQGSMTHGELGSGRFYEFTNGPHRPPLVGLQFSFGDLTISNTLKYGLFADLGERDLRAIEKTLPEAQLLLSYIPPKLEFDIAPEIKRLRNTDKSMLSVAVKPGHTYLVRAVCFEWADMLIALHVLEIFSDRSITIIWKKLEEFAKPPVLFTRDADLQKQVDSILGELEIKDLQITVQDNILFFAGEDKTFERVKTTLLERKIRFRGVVPSIRRNSN